MRKILRLDLVSTLRLFVVFYALIGLWASSKSALSGDTTVDCPFGFYYPLLHFDVNLTINLPNPASWLTPFIVLISIVFYGSTGAISGTALVLLYNYTSRFWPGVKASVEQDALPAALSPTIAVVTVAPVPANEPLQTPPLPHGDYADHSS
jgi:hypothetical protein